MKSICGCFDSNLSDFSGLKDLFWVFCVLVVAFSLELEAEVRFSRMRERCWDFRERLEWEVETMSSLNEVLKD